MNRSAPMNDQLSHEDWSSVKQRVLLRWPELRGSDLDRIKGDRLADKREALVAILETDLGYAHENAVSDVAAIFAGKVVAPDVADETQHTGSSGPIDADGRPVFESSSVAPPAAESRGAIATNVEAKPDAEADPAARPFAGYPRDRLLAIIDDHSRADAAVAALRERGFTDIAVLEGDAGADVLDSDGSEQGVLRKLERAIEQVASEVDHLREYEQATREGATVLAIRAPDDGPRAQAVEVLRQHDARFVNFFGAMAVELLVR